MSDLEEWQNLLRKKMAVLDDLWKSLDDIWDYVPSTIYPQISDRADFFYQSYWDVFHAAVELKTIEELSQALDEPIEEAAEQVVEAWRTVALTKEEELENDIEKARQSGPAQLAEARATLRSAKSYSANGIKQAAEGGHMGAVNSFRECIIACDAGVDQVDDALSFTQNRRDEAKRQQRTISLSWGQLWLAIISIVVVILLSIFGSDLRDFFLK